MFNKNMEDETYDLKKCPRLVKKRMPCSTVNMILIKITDHASIVTKLASLAIAEVEEALLSTKLIQQLQKMTFRRKSTKK
jgi:hypothetical protein